MIQLFNRDGNKSMPKNKGRLLVCYREKYTHVVQGTYLHDGVAAAVAASTSASESASHPAPSQANCDTFAVADAGFQAATYVAPTVVIIATAGVAIAVESALGGVAIAVDSDIANGATSAVDSALAHGATSDLQPNSP
jgi:hypothetical protein